MIVAAMDRILDIIYNSFLKKCKDLENGNMLTDKDICFMWEAFQAYCLLDSNILSLKEKQQILERYEEY